MRQDIIPKVNIFEKYFKDYKDNYVLIGGMACTILLDDYIKRDFRKTYDFDVVLIAENFSRKFGERLMQFIRDGGYKNKQRTDTGKSELFRFLNPDNPAFPQMVELFGHPHNLGLKSSDERLSTFVKIPIGENLSSLSAILLDEDYYNLLKKQKIIASTGVSVLSTSGLILFKIKAWLTLNEEREKNHSVQEKQVEKHRRDIVVLTEALLSRDDEITFISPNIYSDLVNYITKRTSAIKKIEDEGYIDKNKRETIEREKKVLQILSDSYVSSEKVIQIKEENNDISPER